MTNDGAQAAIDAKNRQFWNELCGSQLARELGIQDSSPASLKLFDDWYMDFYPYLGKHLPFDEMCGKQVLEVGLGYGTVSQKIAEAGAFYHGLDVAEGPVSMANDRLRQNRLGGQARQGSILDCPFEDTQFDWCVAVGCYHHTGNLQRAIDETWRVLKPGGTAVIMVYNAYSYRRWHYHPRETFAYLPADKLGLGTGGGKASAAERQQYDVSGDGVAAPETVFTSAAAMQRMAANWSSCVVRRENVTTESIFRNMDRKTSCRYAGPLLGLDIYSRLRK